MPAQMFDDDEGIENAGSLRSGLSFLRAIPGGATPGKEEVATALLVLAALAWLILIRRGFKGVLAK